MGKKYNLLKNSGLKKMAEILKVRQNYFWETKNVLRKRIYNALTNTSLKRRARRVWWGLNE